METQAHTPVMGLREWKEARGFAWSWLATKSGVSYPRLLNGSKGRSPLNADDLGRIAQALGISPDQILDAAPTESTEAPGIAPEESQASAEAASERRINEGRAVDVA